MDILHITESYGGGVTSAINTYVDNSPDFSHHLVAIVRSGDETGEEGKGNFKTVKFVNRDVKSILELKSIVDRISPDVIHIHSTFAGVFCRFMPFLSSRKIVYTPHGFSFLREDGQFFTKGYYLVEKLLSKRAAIIAGCSRSEAMIASEKLSPRKTHEIINVCGPLPDVKAIKSEATLPVVGMVGRIGAQKGYRYFLEVAEALSNKVHFKWIGGGDSERELALKALGVEVTGWLPRNEVLGHLKGLDLYLHTAAWEGFPISVLEAARLEVPIFLRSIRPFTDEGLPVLYNMAQTIEIVSAWSQGGASEKTLATDVCRMINHYHTEENLRSALIELYQPFYREPSSDSLIDAGDGDGHASTARRLGA